MSRSHAARAVDASMSLLNEVLAAPVDPGYAEAAARTAPRRAPGRRLAVTAGHLVLAIALGLATAGAIADLRAPQSAVQQSRAVLVEEITARAAEAEVLAADAAALDAEIGALHAAALADADPDLSAELATVELLAGAVPVAGPALVVELDDAPTTDPATADPLSRVQDVDLQVLTNGLWAAGAEAIAINGQRLTSLSAIRGVGPAILVDLAPLLPPYRVEAIGDPRALQAGLARTSAADHLTLLTGTYGISVATSTPTRVELPASTRATLRHASALDADVASSDPARQKDG